MMRRALPLLALSLIAFLWAVLSPDAIDRLRADENATVVIATASNRGEVDPCG